MNYILRDENAIYYECAYSSDHALYLKCGSEAFFITDSRYRVEAEEQVSGAAVVIASDLDRAARKLLKKHRIKKLAIDPGEWTLQAFETLSSKSDINFKRVPALSHRKRILKREDELKILARAARLGREAFKALEREISRKGFGEDEFSLTYRAKAILSDFGHYDLSFDPIVAIGANAAKPHALPTSRRLKKGGLLLVDAGLKYRRYCSDRTRTASVGKQIRFETDQHFKSRKIQKAYDVVLKAHDRAIEKARSGMKAKKIDALARDLITKAGYGKYFVHSTGHGVGLDIHEMPYISKRSETVIEDGMVYTIEPGIYIPGEFGIRIEDMVMMSGGRAVVL